jgi:sigma-B regulation protein RsbU (phosphoserine phosphatase)
MSPLERQLQLYKGLVEVSGLINGISEHKLLLPAVLEVARRVFGAEAASLFLINELSELVLVAAHGGPAEFDGKLIVPQGRGFAGWVAEHGLPLLVPDAYADDRFFADFDKQTGFRTRSLLCAPLIYQGKKIGVVQVLNPVGRTAFEELELEPFSAYGTLAATAIDKVRSLERQIEQQRSAQECAWAREIQTSFLPQTLPERDDLHFAAAYRPALNVGGDFYDVLETGPDELYFVIGDVSGKGVPAALLMAQAISTLRSIIAPGLAPATVLERWNALLCQHTVRGMFITALLGRANVYERRLELANAGHCPPFRVSPEGKVSESPLPGSAPLGILPQLEPSRLDVTLSSREWMVFYTDGLSESFDPNEELLERSGVAKLLQARFREAGDVIDALTFGERKHRRYAEPHDDLTLLVFGFS